jgi:uncharacterized metal-binding protein YceD (DUF177 family)
MRIIVEEIPEEGLEVDFGPGDPWAVEAARGALGGEVLALAGHLQVRRVGPGVLVRGRASATVGHACDRCLRDVRLTVQGPLSLWYEGLPERGPEQASLSADALDVGFLDGGELELGVTLTEFLALEGPAVVRCGDPQVEVVGEGPCVLAGTPDEPPADHRFAVLKDLKLED